MKIISHSYYWDGGTVKLETDEGTYYVDGRDGTETPQAVYDKHPDEEGALIVGEDVMEELKECLKGYYDQSKAIEKWLKDKFGG